jgi:hypothetical protein
LVRLQQFSTNSKIETGLAMFQRAIDDFKDALGVSVRMTSLAAMAATTLFITTCFLCAAAFVAVLEEYGPVAACLSGAAVFFVVTLLAAGSYMASKKRIAVRAKQHAREQKEHAKSAMHGALADPMLMAAVLQAVRAVGLKKLVPILAVGGLALGFLASRGSSNDEAPAE